MADADKTSENPGAPILNGEHQENPGEVEQKKSVVVGKSQSETTGGTAAAGDRMRNLRIENLPLGILYDKENCESKVRELLNGAFSLPEDAVEAVRRVPVMEDGKEKSCYVVATFRSRVHRNRCYTQRSKLQEPIMLSPDTEEPPAEPEHFEEDKKVEETENKDTTDENLMEEFVVEDEIIEEEEPMEELALEEDEKQQETPQDQSPSKKDEEGKDVEKKADETPKPGETDAQSSIQKAVDTQHTTAGGTSPAKSSTGGPQKFSDVDASRHAEDDEVILDGEEGKDKEEKRTTRVDWYGAPEFQWRTISNPMERSKVTIENVSMGDLTNPFLYNSVLRCKAVNFDCIQSSRHGEFEHAILRKGRLVLTFMSDTQAMSAAVNSLVFVRTRENRRLKIFLPQTPGTLKMSHLLERKLGQVMDPPGRASQLMVRDVGSECTEDMAKEAILKFVPGERLEAVSIEEDSFKRKCAVLTFKDPQTAITVHMRADEIQLGEKERWCKVFHMQELGDAELCASKVLGRQDLISSSLDDDELAETEAALEDSFAFHSHAGPYQSEFEAITDWQEEAQAEIVALKQKVMLLEEKLAGTHLSTEQNTQPIQQQQQPVYVDPASVELRPKSFQVFGVDRRFLRTELHNMTKKYNMNKKAFGALKDLVCERAETAGTEEKIRDDIRSFLKKYQQLNPDAIAEITAGMLKSLKRIPTPGTEPFASGGDSADGQSSRKRRKEESWRQEESLPPAWQVYANYAGQTQQDNYDFSPVSRGFTPRGRDDRRGGRTFPDRRGTIRGAYRGSFRGGSFRGLERGGSSYRGSSGFQRNDRGSSFRGGRGGGRGGTYGRPSSGPSQPWLSDVNRQPTIASARATGPLAFGETKNYDVMETVVKQQQQQLEYQQQLLRQQDIINQLADELSHRRGGAAASLSPTAASPFGGMGSGGGLPSQQEVYGRAGPPSHHAAPYNGPGGSQSYGNAPHSRYGRR